MSAILECSFLIPLKRDSNLSDGRKHKPACWLELETEMFLRFDGATRDAGKCRGFYRDPDTGEKMDDDSWRYTVAVPEENLDRLRQLLTTCCDRFRQKCIYLSIAGRVEFIFPKGN